MSDYCSECGSSEPTDLGHGTLTICCAAPIDQAKFRQPTRGLHRQDDHDDEEW
jgi:hypothetical protein